MQVKSWKQLVEVVLIRKISFVMAFFVIFTLSYALLSWLDFLPELVESKEEKALISDSTASDTLSVTNNEANDSVIPALENLQKDNLIVPEASLLSNVLPTSIYFSTLNKRVDVLNPTSRSVADLDNALLKGAVRHPDSATLDRYGTVFILGHSSHLPIVNNKAFQAFNDIQKLKWGDLVEVTSAEGIYVYRVEKVYRAKAQNVTVPIAGDTKKLYLATCDSFGSIDDRYIVEANLVETRLN